VVRTILAKQLVKYGAVTALVAMVSLERAGRVSDYLHQRVAQCSRYCTVVLTYLIQYCTVDFFDADFRAFSDTISHASKVTYGYALQYSLVRVGQPFCGTCMASALSDRTSSLPEDYLLVAYPTVTYCISVHMQLGLYITHCSPFEIVSGRRKHSLY